MKTLSLLGQRIFHKDKSSSERIEKTKVRASIETYCQEFLKDFDDVFTFEALPNAIDNTLAVVEEPALCSKYEILQVNETLFEVRLRELNIV